MRDGHLLSGTARYLPLHFMIACCFHVCIWGIHQFLMCLCHPEENDTILFFLHYSVKFHSYEQMIGSRKDMWFKLFNKIEAQDIWFKINKVFFLAGLREPQEGQSCTQLKFGNNWSQEFKFCLRIFSVYHLNFSNVHIILSDQLSSNIRKHGHYSSHTSHLEKRIKILVYNLTVAKELIRLKCSKAILLFRRMIEILIDFILFSQISMLKFWGWPLKN